MAPTLTLESTRRRAVEQIIHLTVHVLTSGKQSSGEHPMWDFHLARAHFPCRIYGIQLVHFERVPISFQTDFPGQYS